MATADEYRQYAVEGLHWAEEAKTDHQRQSFLDMARDWTLAALNLAISKDADGASSGTVGEGRASSVTGRTPVSSSGR